MKNITRCLDKNYSSSTTSSSKNAKASLYGSDMGTLTLGFQDSSNKIEGTTQANTHITAGNKATLTSTQDTTLKGVVVDANELEVNTGRNLVMQSEESPHSTYDCRSNPNAMCGERKW